MFTLDSLLQDVFPQRSPPAWQRSLLRTLLREKEFRQFAAEYPHLKGLDLIEQVVDYFHLSCELVDGDLENIPSQGPVVLVANHPIGSLDGLVLLRTVAAVRPDVKVVANQLLSCIEPLRNLFVPVDNLGNRTNRQQIAAMQAQLDNQGVLILFPAGEVSRMSPKGIRDGHWHTGFLRLAAKARAPIVPIHISARNSGLFYLTSLIYRPLSTLLLVREMFKQQGGRIKIRIGGRIPFAHWHDGHTQARDLAERFRRHVYRLGQGKQGLFTSESAIALAEDRLELKKALAACERLGVTPDGKTIFLYRRQGEARAPILRELGRLREIAFRAVGEGSGRRRDLDSYDDDYYHLVLWDEEELEIVGAYRFIPTAPQLASKGLAGIYSNSLFHYDRDMTPRSLNRGLSWVVALFNRPIGGSAVWITCGSALAPIWPNIRSIAICSARYPFQAVCRLPLAIC
ncbi:2-acyl-glycerophospho-ethanolamine acyltransferase [Serratia fonticola]|uniref:L-ornithine N(alpha)-acyltransferase n=1 Tax=Serratia fonticola TaxID=47917 RepID=A0A3S4XMT9_SERFO|nr:2-acyl-glycerophospho-ethanolamine acyltransferase [Serratia fonticola]